MTTGVRAMRRIVSPLAGVHNAVGPYLRCLDGRTSIAGGTGTAPSSRMRAGRRRAQSLKPDGLRTVECLNGEWRPRRRVRPSPQSGVEVGPLGTGHPHRPESAWCQRVGYAHDAIDLGGLAEGAPYPRLVDEDVDITTK